MTNFLPTTATPRPRLLRFLLPVIIAHGLLLASIPYWPDDEQRPAQGMRIELAASAQTPPAQPAEALPTSTETDHAAQAEEIHSPAVVTVLPRKKTLPTPSTSKPVVAQVIPAPLSSDTAPISADPIPDQTQAANAANTVTPKDQPSASAPPPDWRLAYRRDLSTALARAHQYPPRAKRFGQTGTAHIAFRITADGHFADIHLAKGSGADLLDQAAMDTVHRLGRFRALPPDYSDDGWAISVPLVYRLD